MSDTPKDPLVRFVAGCAIVAAVVIALIVCVVVAVGFRLTRDESPGHPQEAFLLGDETRYWRADLRVDDAGLAALFKRISEVNDERRRALLRGTFLEGIPLPSRKARLDELAPLTVEIGVVMGESGGAAAHPVAWTGRGTFSRGMFKMRALIKLFRWLGKPGAKADEIIVDGVPVSTIGPGLAVATVGNRVLVASDTSRMQTVLQTAKGGQPADEPKWLALHDGVKLSGEDAWAFAKDVGGGAAASFDVDDRDELVVRIAVADGGAFDGTLASCRAVASSFLPRMPAEVIDIDGNAAADPARGARTFTARITGLSKRFAALVALSTDPKLREWKSAPETPSASPIPPSPPRPAGPRSDTPAEPKREGNPKPPR